MRCKSYQNSWAANQWIWQGSRCLRHLRLAHVIQGKEQEIEPCPPTTEGEAERLWARWNVDTIHSTLGYKTPPICASHRKLPGLSWRREERSVHQVQVMIYKWLCHLGHTIQYICCCMIHL